MTESIWAFFIEEKPKKNGQLPMNTPGPYAILGYPLDQWFLNWGNLPSEGKLPFLGG